MLSVDWTLQELDTDDPTARLLFVLAAKAHKGIIHTNKALQRMDLNEEFLFLFMFLFFWIKKLEFILT